MGVWERVGRADAGCPAASSSIAPPGRRTPCPLYFSVKSRPARPDVRAGDELHAGQFRSTASGPGVDAAASPPGSPDKVFISQRLLGAWGCPPGFLVEPGPASRRTCWFKAGEPRFWGPVLWRPGPRSPSGGAPGTRSLPAPANQVREDVLHMAVPRPAGTTAPVPHWASFAHGRTHIGLQAHRRAGSAAPPRTKLAKPNTALKWGHRRPPVPLSAAWGALSP